MKTVIAAMAMLISGSMLCANAVAATVELIVTVPEHTPCDATLTLGGDFNGWNPQASDYQMVKLGDGRFRYVFSNIAQGKVLNFKVTRGSWETVEIADSGANRDNRNIAVTREVQQHELTVAEWADMSTKEAPSTIVGNVVMQDIELPTFPGVRQLRIYLPPDYATGSKHYPVIYMSDAQNVFDNKTANAGEWQMDELMESLAAQNSALLSIVVAIDHAGDNRTMEYLPFRYGGASWSLFDWNKGKLGKGKQFADWLANDLKQHIDTTYRTLPEREHTTIMGSSMGGLIACYTALRHQQTFSKAACYSSAFVKQLVGDEWIDYINTTPKRHPVRFHMDMGDNEFGLFGDDILDETQEVHDALLAAGFAPENVRYQVIKGGTHDEPSWRSRTLGILTWLNSPRK
ncbi:alpha/beta hydrolase [Alteromonas gracilis]|uniref:alpha/beta hydrolase n=1 Tax=Alteromonas gracilis TaxID=1479524 RepID=UPI0037370070